MRKLLLDFIRNDTTTAAAKAESDVAQFLKASGFLGRYYDLDIARLVKYIFEGYILRKKVKDVTKQDVLFFQYSMYGRIAFKKWLKMVKQNHCKIVLLHDIQSLRENLSQHEIEKELLLFKEANCLIVHNDQMAEWLKNNGCSVPMVSLEIFDYAQVLDLSSDRVRDYRTVVFAGNLDKSPFLEKLSPNYPIDLYGLKTIQSDYHENVSYLGSKSANEIPDIISQYGFGLVWDGPELDACSGSFGDYMRYNNPHKTSLYLSSGVPVIIWKQAALARFVEKEKVGLVVESLEEVSDLLAQLTDADYALLRDNANRLSEKLRQGHYTLKAVRLAIEYLQQYSQ